MPRGVECRSGGASGDYKMVFSFSNNLTSVASASVTGGCGSVVSGTSGIGPNPNQYTANLTGVTCIDYVTVTLNNVNDSAGNHSDTVPGPEMGVLVGDTTGNGSVNASDISQTKSKSGLAVDSTNFRTDVTVNGSINSSDISTVKSKSGTALP